MAGTCAAHMRDSWVAYGRGGERAARAVVRLPLLLFAGAGLAMMAVVLVKSGGWPNALLGMCLLAWPGAFLYVAGRIAVGEGVLEGEDARARGYRDAAQRYRDLHYDLDAEYETAG